MAQIPLPPSANRLWRVFGGRVCKSRHYVEWLEHVTWLLRREMKPVAGPAHVSMLLRGGKGITVRSDLDNLIKPTIDALKGAGILVDDNLEHVVGVDARYEPRTSRKDVAEFFVEVRQA